MTRRTRLLIWVLPRAVIGFIVGSLVVFFLPPLFKGRTEVKYERYTSSTTSYLPPEPWGYSSRDDLLDNIVRARALSGDTVGALETAAAIANQRTREKSFQAIIEYRLSSEVSENDLKWSKYVANKIEIPEIESRALTTIATTEYALGNKSSASSLFRKAVEAASSVESRESGSQSAMSLSPDSYDVPIYEPANILSWWTGGAIAALLWVVLGFANTAQEGVTKVAVRWMAMRFGWTSIADAIHEPRQTP